MSITSVKSKSTEDMLCMMEGGRKVEWLSISLRGVALADLRMSLTGSSIGSLDEFGAVEHVDFALSVEVRIAAFFWEIRGVKAPPEPLVGCKRRSGLSEAMLLSMTWEAWRARGPYS